MGYIPLKGSLVHTGTEPSPLEIFVKILTKTLPRSMQDSDIKNLGRIMPDLSQMYVWPMQDLDMVEPWYTQDPDMIKLWCTQDPTKISMQDSYMVKADLGMVMYVMYIMHDS